MMRLGDSVVEGHRCCTQARQAVCHGGGRPARRRSATVDESRGIVSRSFGRTIGAAGRLLAWLRGPIDAPDGEPGLTQAEAVVKAPPEYSFTSPDEAATA